jgi:hypothetical protein
LAFLAAAAPYIGLATTAVSAYSQAEQGKAAQANAQLQAIQDERAANQTQVEAQRQSQTERKRAQMVRSRALAVAGASGAGVSDPTVSNILTDIDAEGELNALNSLWSGDYTARALKMGANASRNEGAAMRSSGYLSGATTALNGGMSFFDKYGGRDDDIGYVTTTSRRI